jgi:hypothetical protein
MRYKNIILCGKLATRFTQTLSRDGRQRGARRYSSLSLGGVDAFYFNVLQLTLIFIRRI